MDRQIKSANILGCLFGSAFGDALAAPTEFLSVPEILQRWPPSGPDDLPDPALVTDDTQMALAVGEALVAAHAADDLSPRGLEQALRSAFVAWSESPDNTRAPGRTCLAACEALADGRPWTSATVAGSKGCGANMRVAPVGLLSAWGIGAEERAAIAQFQAALTHGHPTALAASDLTAFTVAYLAEGGDSGSLPQALRDYALSQRTVYHAAWLGDLWKRPAATSPEDFIARGWDECLGILDRLDQALTLRKVAIDPCLFTGEGWIAEEAFATGLLCFLYFSDDPRRALKRAAVTAGDSDSIACLTGAFAGAALGLDVWTQDWRERIEYRERLLRLGEGLQRSTTGER